MLDSARAGELDFAKKARQLLAECKASSNLKIQYEALYALAYTDTDLWCTTEFDDDYNPVTVPLPASSQYKALEALSKFIKEHPEEADEHATKCDVLKEFERRS